MEKFIQLVEAQGGDARYVQNPGLFPKAEFIEVTRAEQSGYLSQINARTIGEASVILGAGREKKGQEIDHAVGIVIRHKVGDYVQKGDVLFEIHANKATLLAEAKTMVFSAYKFSKEPVDKLPMIYRVLS